MQKTNFVGMVLAVAMLGVSVTVYADTQNLGVISLNGNEEVETETVELDDMKLDETVSVAGFGDITAVSFDFLDKFRSYTDASYWDAGYHVTNRAGDQEKYMVLKVKVLNTTTDAEKYLKEDCSVKVVYDDTYEYQGWFFQSFDDENPYAIDKPGDAAFIDPLYYGYYMFGCTVPNTVAEGNAPLRMEIEFDGNEITYNVQK